MRTHSDPSFPWTPERSSRGSRSSIFCSLTIYFFKSQISIILVSTILPRGLAMTRRSIYEARHHSTWTISAFPAKLRALSITAKKKLVLKVLETLHHHFFICCDHICCKFCSRSRHGKLFKHLTIRTAIFESFCVVLIIRSILRSWSLAICFLDWQGKNIFGPKILCLERSQKVSARALLE